MTFFVRKINRNIAANFIKLLACRHIFFKFFKLPAEPKYRRCTGIPCLFYRRRNYFFQKFFRRRFSVNGCADFRDTDTYRIMRVTVAASRHYQPFAGVVNDFSIFVNKIFSAIFIADVNKLAGFNRKRLDNLITFGSEDFTVNNHLCCIIFHHSSS